MGKAVSMRWETMGIKESIGRLKAFEGFVREICREPKAERQLFEREWVLKPVGKNAATAHRFGGKIEPTVGCPGCGGATNLMADIDLADVALPRTKLERRKLPLFWCLTCLEWEPVFYDFSGAVPRPLDQTGKLVVEKKLEVGEEDLPERPAALVAVAHGKKAGRKSKVGGKASWVQQDESPDCPKCAEPMAFAAQLASDRWIAYSDMGLLYAFVCPECCVVATLVQSH